MPLISWRDFLDDVECELVEHVALRAVRMTPLDPVLEPWFFELMCSDAMWKIYPERATEFAVALVVEARRPSPEAAESNNSMTVHADEVTWAALLDAEERGDTDGLARIAEELFGSLGEAEARAGRLQAGLSQATLSRPRLPGSHEATGRLHAVDEVVPPGPPAGLAGAG